MRTLTLSLCALGASLVGLPHALADDDAPPVTEFSEQLVHEKTESVEIELNSTTVLCSHADYSAAFLKVLIPELAEFTMLDHRNAGAGAPCVAAGMCAPFGDSSPAQILDDSRPTEQVDIHVRLSRGEWVNHEEKTCTVSLIERVEVDIRGVPFYHERSAGLGSRFYEDCL